MAKKQLDNQIKKLQEIISVKEAELSQIKKPAWRTNCSIVIDGNRKNLHVINDDACVDVLAFLIREKESYERAAEALGVKKEFTYGGSFYGEWLHDLKLRITIFNKRNKEAQLKLLRKRLEGLMSEDAKKAKEFDDIASLLQDM